MWTRQELKAKGKAAFKANYWRSVLVSFIATALLGVSYKVNDTGTGGIEQFQADLNAAAAQADVSMGLIIAVLVGLIGIATVVSFAIILFLRNPILVGVDRFYLVNADEPASLHELLYSFEAGNYLNIVLAMFLSALFIGLWSLLLIIPGIIKMFDYYLVTYILADEPELSAMDALRKSQAMMRGHRWNTFVLNLSFFGWLLLGGLTFGLLNVFYVSPYMQATDAELYRTLKANYVE